MLIKIVHMIAGSLAIILFYTQAILILKRRHGQKSLPADRVPSNTGLAKILKIALHTSWTVLIVAGIYLLVQLSDIYPYWLLAKIGLFVLAVVFSSLSFLGRGSKQVQNIGLIGGSICYALIIFLVIVKPWGYLLTGNVNQPIAGSASVATEPTH